MGLHKGKRVQDKGQVKRVKVAHDKCGDARLDYVLFPIGFRYNKELQELRRGDIVVFLDGSEHYVWASMRVSIKIALVEYLCRMRYGFGIARAMEIWQDRLRVRKEDVRLMSDSECLILFFEREEVRYEEDAVKI